MSSPEREGPATGPQEKPDRSNGEAGVDENDGGLLDSMKASAAKSGSPKGDAQATAADAASGTGPASPDATSGAAKTDDPSETGAAETSAATSDDAKKPDAARGADAEGSGAATVKIDAAKPGDAKPGEARKSDAPSAAPKDEAKSDDTNAAAPAAAEERDTGTGGIRVRYYGRTDVGLIREHNEDNFLVADLTRAERDVETEEARKSKLGERGAIFAVCDGMGGAAAGEVASQMAVDTIYEFFSHAERVPKDRDHFARRLVLAIEEAGNRIFSAAKMDRTRRGMGTTATVAGLVDKVLFVGQVGDSRAYILRGEQLGLITKDQSLVNQLIEAGQLTDEEAEAFEHSNIILQALGTTEDVTVDLTFLELRRGDKLMLCSDGLSGLVHPEMIKDVLAKTPDLVEASEKLIEMANAGGGHDNITVVCVEFHGDDLPEPKPADKPAYQQYPLPVAEDEDRESLPPRNTHIKEGGRKPGSDVKGRTDEARAHSLAAMREATADEPVRPFSWGLILVVLLLAAAATVVAVAMGGRNTVDAVESDPEQVAVEPELPPSVEAQIDEEEMIEVRVVTDVTGELAIDGVRYGELVEGEEVYVELPPGAHRFEAISGENVVTSAIVQLRPGVPADVALTMPTGIADPNEGAGSEAEGAEGGTDTGTQGGVAVRDGDRAGGTTMAGGGTTTMTGGTSTGTTSMQTTETGGGTTAMTGGAGEEGGGTTGETGTGTGGASGEGGSTTTMAGSGETGTSGGSGTTGTSGGTGTSGTTGTSGGTTTRMTTTMMAEPSAPPDNPFE